ncbi:MAG: DUF6152 family protein [Candidatus Rariloculaceae bacterium]
MKFLVSILMIAVAASAAVSSALAHHSIWGVFNPETPFSITGSVTSVDWINPHVFVHLEVADERGATTAWRLETLPTAFMRRAGINKEMLMGDGGPVTVTGIVAHADANMGWVHRITYADGHFYQMSNEGLDEGASQPSVPGE